MRERLLDRHARELGAPQTAERAAGGGHRETLDRAGPGVALRRDQLVQRRVLGVDRQDPRARRLGERGDELAADDQRLLVGERQVDPLAERHDRRAKARRADDRVQHEVGRGLEHQLDEALRPGVHGARRPRLRRQLGAVLVGQGDLRDGVRARLLDERLPGGARREADQLELVGGVDHLERLHADRAGRPEYEDPLGAHLGPPLIWPTGSQARRSSRRPR